MTNWIIPCNEKKYNHRGAFEKLNVIDWRQSTNVEIGDYVFIYAGRPTSSVMYKCEVILTDITEGILKDDKEFNLEKFEDPIKKRYMRLKLLEKYPEGRYPREEILNNGVKTVQGPSKVNEDFIIYIESKKAISPESEKFIDFVDNIDSEILGHERETLVKARVNQSAYRKKLLQKNKKCCLCGVRNSDFLVASHIKPWSQSSPVEKTDINNGLLLCPAHDKLFDGGYISFDENGKIMISKYLDEIDSMFMNINSEMKINIYPEREKYMKYHRNNIFRK